MALPTDINPFVQFAGGADSGDLGEPIPQSLRFSPTAYLEKTSYTSPTTFTLSCWVKNSEPNNSFALLSQNNDPGGASGGYGPVIWFTSGSFQYYTGSSSVDSSGNIRFRDPNAWYHAVVQQTATTYTGWINGVVYFSGTRSATGNTSGNFHIKRNFNGWLTESGGYLAEYHLLEAQALSATDFGRFNEEGIWVPIATDFSTAQYGSKGFHLTFDSSQANGVGHDSSGQGNHFTTTSIETTAVSASNFDNDIDYKDTPTSNYATLQILDKGKGKGTDADANLAVYSGSSGQWEGNRLSTQIISSGKWYWEVQDNQPEIFLGVADQSYWAQFNSWANKFFGGASSGNSLGYYTYNGNKYENGTVTSYGPSGSAGDIYMVAWDGDTGTIWVGRNGTWNNSATESEIVAGNTTNAMFTGKTGEDWRAGVCHAYTTANTRAKINYGQRPFIYTQPSGYNALETNNISNPTIKQGKKHFGLLKYQAPGSPTYPITINGSGGNNGDGELDFDQSPDFVWIKMINSTQNHTLFDSLRGNTKSLRTDENIAEATRTNFDFATNGFTFSSADAETYQQNDQYMAWCWKAGGAPTTTNSNSAGASQTAGSVKVNGNNSSFAQGTIKVNKMSVNTTAGFSIVQYTGTGSAGTIPHGLGAVPEMGIFKRIDGVSSWDVYHRGLDGDATRNILLDQGSSQTAENIAYWNNTLPTSTLFSLGAGGNNNSLNEECIGYIWTPIEGYSKFGSYRGTGSSGVNGAFVYLGFKPAFLMVRVYSQAGNWMMWDAQRSPNNPIQNRFTANTAGAEASYASQEVDFLSNGFQMRGNDSDVNETYYYIYMALGFHEQLLCAISNFDLWQSIFHIHHIHFLILNFCELLQYVVYLVLNSPLNLNEFLFHVL